MGPQLRVPPAKNRNTNLPLILPHDVLTPCCPPPLGRDGSSISLREGN